MSAEKITKVRRKLDQVGILRLLVALRGEEALFDEVGLKRALASLGEKEQRVIELRFGLGGDEPQTLKKVGEQLSVTCERIRQIEAKALRKLRHSSRANALLATLFNPQQFFENFEKLKLHHLYKTFKGLEELKQRIDEIQADGRFSSLFSAEKLVLIKDMSLSTYIVNALHLAGFRYAFELLGNKERLSYIRGLGQGAKVKIHNALNELGILSQYSNFLERLKSEGKQQDE